MIRFLTRRVSVALAAVVVVAGSGGLAAAQGSAGAPSRAVFDDKVIDLADGWGEAGACAELGVNVECFRTEADLLAAHPELADVPAAAQSGSAVAAQASSCSSHLRLHRLTGHSGGALYLTTRLVIHNLSSYGFDNDTSSYSVGACSSSFYSGSNLGGSLYPGSTGAYASASSMVGGWNNVVSSVIIY